MSESGEEVKPKQNERLYRSLDEAFDAIGRFGRYQIFTFIVIQYLCIPNASNMTAGFFRLGGLVPDYECLDRNNSFYLNSNAVRKNSTNACEMVRSCSNLKTHNAWTSIYEEFMWVCEPDNLGSTISSLMPIVNLFAHFFSGHMSDYFGRKWLFVFGMGSRVVLSLAEASSPNWHVYMTFNVIAHFLGVIHASASFSLVVETVHSEYRMIAGYAFQYSLGFVIAGAGAYLTGNWRRLLIIMNISAIPGIILLSLFVESPRFLMQNKKYEEAARAMNRIAWVNGKSVRFSADQMITIQALTTSHAPRSKKYSVWHLFSNYRLASYSVAQVLTGICINILQSVVFFNIQDLSGNPLMNVSLMGLLRMWTPLIAITLETKYKNFGRKRLLVGSLGLTMMGFAVMLVIDMLEMGATARAVGTGAVLFGYVVQAGLVWIAYKLYTTELFPTVIRSIALSTFSITSQVGSVIGPQLIYLRKYWHSWPYAGAVISTFLATVLSALLLPETKSEPLQDTVHDAKRRRLAFENQSPKRSIILAEEAKLTEEDLLQKQ